MKYSYGKIKYMKKLPSKKYEFANTDDGILGSPIFLEGTTCVVGIFKGSIESKEENYGDFIWPIFSYFINFEDNINRHNNNYFNNESNNVIKVKNILNNNINFGNNANEINKRNKSKTENKLNQLTIIYKNNSYNSIRLFGDDFVKNNINNCYLLIDGKRKKLCEELKLNKKQKKQNILEIKLIEINTITNMSHMFNDCSSLKSLSDISKCDTKNVTNMSGIFFGCSSLKSLPDIYKWDTKNVPI